MEAIYNDGTPEGYFEALLCQKFLTALPYACFERENWDIYMIEPPKEPDQWDVRLDIRDWRPRVYFYNGKPSTVVAWKRRIENGLGSSSGRDEVFLTEYHFQHDLGTSHMIQRWQGSWRKIKGEISDDSRYTDRRHCCVAGSSSVLIATEKTNSGHPWKLYHVLKELYG